MKKKRHCMVCYGICYRHRKRDNGNSVRCRFFGFQAFKKIPACLDEPKTLRMAVEFGTQGIVFAQDLGSSGGYL